MLPLNYPLRWRVAGILLLLIVLAFAVTPEIWPWSGRRGSHLFDDDKWMHGVTFAALAVWYTGQYARSAYWRLAFGLLVFGLLIEAWQAMLIYTTAETGDLVADVIGICAGIAIALGGTGGWSLRLEGWLQNRRE